MSQNPTVRAPEGTLVGGVRAVSNKNTYVYIHIYTLICSTPLNTATHCNTLQHTATHCNTLQHTATHCNTLQHTATHCNALQHTATHCNTLQHTGTIQMCENSATRRIMFMNVTTPPSHGSDATRTGNKNGGFD